MTGDEFIRMLQEMAATLEVRLSRLDDADPDARLHEELTALLTLGEAVMTGTSFDETARLRDGVKERIDRDLEGDAMRANVARRDCFVVAAVRRRNGGSDNPKMIAAARTEIEDILGLEKGTVAKLERKLKRPSRASSATGEPVSRGTLVPEDEIARHIRMLDQAMAPNRMRADGSIDFAQLIRAMYEDFPT